EPLPPAPPPLPPRPGPRRLPAQGRAPLPLGARGPRPPPQAPQQREGLAVRARLRVLRGLAGPRHAREAAIPHQPLEGLDAQVTPPDLLVAIEAGAERLLGVVQVEG